MKNLLRLELALALASSVILWSGPASAQEATDVTDRLREAIEARPERPAVDTALVFTNLANAPAKVSMKAYHANGHPVGGHDMEVPGNGVAYVMLSDLIHDAERRVFLGKVEAVGRGKLTGTGVLVGGPLTDLPAIVRYRRVPEADNTTRPVTQITFPVAATY